MIYWFDWEICWIILMGKLWTCFIQIENRGAEVLNCAIWNRRSRQFKMCFLTDLFLILQQSLKRTTIKRDSIKKVPNINSKHIHFLCFEKVWKITSIISHMNENFRNFAKLDILLKKKSILDWWTVKRMSFLLCFV